jgi:nucleotide-binding universal stress UspA family protein
MNERVLVPLDGSETAEAILPQARRFLKCHEAEVILLQALPKYAPDFHFAVPGRREEVTAYIRKRAFELIQDGIPAQGLVKHGNAASVILETAEAERVSMIAMSTHGRTGLERFVFGSVAEKVLRAGPVPIFLVRSFAKPGLSRGRLEELPLRNILVPLDGSPESARVISLVGNVARPLDSHVTLLHVVEADPLAPHWPPLEKSLDEARKSLTDGCIPNRIEERQGDPATEILRFCEENGSDLIMMGSHGRSGPSRWVLGSVTEKVLRAAPVPMIVARRPAARPEEIAIPAEASASLPPM